MYVIGTSGHVDHGKSTLVHALTGIDPDRLREEKERGLTIDLGFAWLTLPSGREISIVDVPGHERFIKNMLAGAGGVSLALLIVAADEGPMPQTLEHLAILELLDVPSAIVVITKIDTVEPDYVDLVEAELEETLAATPFAGSPVVRTSAHTGEGLSALLGAIDAALETTPARRDLGRPRLPIDRAFTIQGFGAVVTGTLLDGAFEVGQEVELQPGRLRARIRGLQRHRTKVSRLEPGTRAAINLSGVHAEDISRGMVLALPGAIPPVRAVDVRLHATRLLPHPVAHDAGVTFLSATSESEARLRLLDTEALNRGEEAWAQVILTTPVAVLPGDHCVLRTSNDTVAGGRIVAINPRRHRRSDPAVIAALERLLEGTPEDRLLDLLLAGPLRPADAAARLQFDAPALAAATAALLATGAAREHTGLVIAEVWLASAASAVRASAADYLAANALRAAAPREHVRRDTRLDAAAFDLAVAEAVAHRAIEERGAGLAPAGYQVTLTPAQQQQVDRFLAALRAHPYDPPTDTPPDAPLLAFLAASGQVVQTGAGVIFDAAAFATMLERTTAHLRETGSVSLAEVRDLFGTSRKYAQAFLEHLDALHVTRRTGETRVLHRPESAA